MCPTKGTLTCSCECTKGNNFFDFEKKLCQPVDIRTTSGHCSDELKKKIQIPETLGEEASKKDIGKNRRERRLYRDGHLKSLKGTNGTVIDDDFPVWAVTILVSGFVTAAMGIVLYFY